MIRLKAIAASAIAAASIAGTFALGVQPASAHEANHTGWLPCDNERAVKVAWHLDGKGGGTNCIGLLHGASQGLLYTYEFYQSWSGSPTWIDGISTGDHRVRSMYAGSYVQDLPKWSTYSQPSAGPWRVDYFVINA